jgi:hypothetical protein
MNGSVHVRGNNVYIVSLFSSFYSFLSVRLMETIKYVRLTIDSELGRMRNVSYHLSGKV